MSVTVLFDFTVKPEVLEEMKTAMKGSLAETRAYDGCEGVHVEQDLDNENRIVMIEHWASKEHHEKYFAWRTETGFVGKMMELVTGPPVVTYLNDTGL